MISHRYQGLRLFHLLLVAFLLLFIIDCSKTTNSGGSKEPVLLQQVTTGQGFYPTLSPDGQWLAYALLDSGIVKMNLKSGHIDTLTRFGSEPNWSKAGNLILFSRNRLGNRILGTINTASGRIDTVRIGGYFDGAVWSPSGDEIAAAGSPGIVIISYPNGDTSSLPCSGELDACNGEMPGWSNDGTWICFVGAPGLQKIRRDGGIPEILVPRANGEPIHPVWSPDGKWIAYAREDSSSEGVHLWVTDARGPEYGLWQVTRTDTTCTLSPCMDFQPCWSSDSRILYFASTRDGRWSIWRIGFAAPPK